MKKSLLIQISKSTLLLYEKLLFTFLFILNCSVIVGQTQKLEFSRHISPILSEHCFECHGPDQDQIKGDLRLDNTVSAKLGGKSGKPAITSGSLRHSELYHRITSNRDSERMPPPENGNPLTPDEIAKLKQWIREGGTYSPHWAFRQRYQPAIPQNLNSNWPYNEIDTFILAKLKANKLAPTKDASKEVLIRRAFIDLVGIPPSTAEIDAFVNDNSDNAWASVIDNLLSRKEYGQRWGRHWLDVVRYADSNGSDENHAYPHAYHYRNYVIQSFNDDLPYNKFIEQQLAGDILANRSADPNDQFMKTGTGFLAIGTKILAEQDPVKKQADIVDEQIDTFGKTFLGLTIACARCHDHKFDPIPTKDYYALAGIFHSSSIVDGDIKDNEFLKQSSDYLKKLHHLEGGLDQIQTKLKQLIDPKNAILREAEQFDRGNVIIDTTQYGNEIGIISDPGGGKNYVEFDLQIQNQGYYLFEIRYAAKKARLGSIVINGKKVIEKALSHSTGGWMPEHQAWHNEGIVQFKTGVNVMRIESSPNMSHLDKWRLTPLHENVNVIADLIEQKLEFQNLISQEQTKEPIPIKVMSLKDDTIQDVSIHIRGNHNELGTKVKRGVLSGLEFDYKPLEIKNFSGRWELSQWLTNSQNPLTARVLVNRIWHWHFGQGIVNTPNNFGLKGNRPTHPDLLEFLANKLIEENWSIKSLHRIIMNSHVYQLDSIAGEQQAKSKDPENRLYWKFNKKRMEAEVFRDSILFLNGKLDTKLGGGTMEVVSQNPSPADIQKNNNFYQTSVRRSVYLPVVRSHIYELFDLMDFPKSTTSIGKRNSTTVPTQALMLMNSPFLIHQANGIADSFLLQSSLNKKQMLRSLFRHILSISPSKEMIRNAEEMMKHSGLSEKESLQLLCHTLLMSDKFIYIR